MAVIERWDVFICPSCGTLYPDLSTLCECELPNNVEGVETERVTVVPADQLRGNVELIAELKHALDMACDALRAEGHYEAAARWHTPLDYLG